MIKKLLDFIAFKGFNMFMKRMKWDSLAIPLAGMDDEAKGMIVGTKDYVNSVLAYIPDDVDLPPKDGMIQ